MFCPIPPNSDTILGCWVGANHAVIPLDVGSVASYFLCPCKVFLFSVGDDELVCVTAVSVCVCVCMNICVRVFLRRRLAHHCCNEPHTDH